MPTRPAQADTSRTPAAWATLALLAGISLVNAVGVGASLLLLAEPDESQLLFGSPVSDWFWALSALLFIALTIVCAVVFRAVWRRDAGAGLAVSVLGLIGIGYSLLSITHGYGWVVLVASLALLVSNQTATAENYYSGHALSARTD